MRYLPVKKQMDLICRGVEEILPENELIGKLQKSIDSSNQSIRDLVKLQLIEPIEELMLSKKIKKLGDNQ